MLLLKWLLVLAVLLAFPPLPSSFLLLSALASHSSHHHYLCHSLLFYLPFLSTCPCVNDTPVPTFSPLGPGGPPGSP